MTALHDEINNTEKLKVLLDNGFHPDVVNTRGHTVLQLSAHKGLKDNVVALLNAGANPLVGSNPHNGFNSTARRFAKMNGYKEIVELLEKAEGDYPKRG